jgi:uncharacterized protein
MSATIDDIEITADENNCKPARSKASQRLSQRRRAAVITRWLRKIHLYVGLWGAVLGLLFGATGILMNHRAILKIPIEKQLQKTSQLAVPSDGFKNEKEMAAWLTRVFAEDMKFTSTMEVRAKTEPAKKIIWGDSEVTQPARWTFNFHGPHKGVNAEYFVGNRFVKLDNIDATPIGTLTRLHMAVGVNVFWVLLSDTIAGGMIVLSITGLLLWSRLNRIKLIAIATSTGALLASVWFMWSAV